MIKSIGIHSSSRHVHLFVICSTVLLYTVACFSTIKSTTAIAVDHIAARPTSITASKMTMEPNPPNWPDSVKLIRPSDLHNSERTDFINSIKNVAQDEWNNEAGCFTSKHHFSDRRTVVMFAPGVYENFDLQVGYYTQVIGLGKSPNDVKFTNCQHGIYVSALNKHLHPPFGTCLDTFWRSAENFSQQGTDLQWAVSQAAPLRRVHVIEANLVLFDHAAYASGGHLANTVVDKHMYMGAQQQYLVRHSKIKEGASGGAWSMVYVGCTGQVPHAHPGCSARASVTVLDNPSVRIEKPYVSMQTDYTRFDLRIPQAIFNNDVHHYNEGLVGPNFSNENEIVRSFDQVYVAKSTEPVSRIHDALNQGKDVVLTPGIYQLDETLHVRHVNQVVLGLGLATLTAPTNGSPCLHVQSGTNGVRIAGIMLEASPIENKSCPNETTNANDKTSLLEWGEPGVKDIGDAKNPGGLIDVFCRVGGATFGDRHAIRLDHMMRLHSDNIVADNLWLWRADHAELRPGEMANYPHISTLYYQSEKEDFYVGTGLEVNGDDIVIYGLAVEHANGHQTVWNGERGQVAFYQCELPYCASHDSFGVLKYSGYKVADKVNKHEVYAPGIYTNFRNEPVQVATAMIHPDKEGIRFINPFTVHLDNHYGAMSVVNGRGKAAEIQGAPIRLDV